MSKVNVGLLGFGLAGSVFHAPLIQSCPDMNLSAIGSRSFDGKEIPEGVKAANFDDVFNDPAIDLIVVATPNTSHFPLAAQALRAGKNVVVDKPFVIRVSEAEALINLAEEKGKLLSVFQNRRWDSGFLTAQSVIGQGKLGKISHAEFQYNRFNPNVKDRWREEPGPGAGVLCDLGPHLIDQAYCLLGMPTSVTANVAIQREGARVDDYFHLILEYGSARAVLHASSLMYDHGPRIALYGDKASLHQFGLDGQEDDLKAGKRPGDEGWGRTHTDKVLLLDHDGSSREIPTLPGAYDCYYKQVAQALLTGGDCPVKATDARNTFAILEAAIVSAMEKRTVALV